MTSTTTEITEATILENRRRWAEALRSGEYGQTRGALCNDEGYCCLGVAVAIIDGHLHTGDGNRKLMPTEDDAAAFGLVDPNTHATAMTGVVAEGGRRLGLDELNDGYGFTFAEIADLIDDGQVELHVPAGGAA